MKIPESIAKFASRKLAAVLATLLTHYLISKGLGDASVAGWQEAIAQGLMSLADAVVTIFYLREQGKIDHAAIVTPDEVVDSAMSRVRAAAVEAQKKSTIEVVGEEPIEHP